MRDFYLKFESKEEARKELLKAGFEGGEENSLSHPKAVVDVIGTIYKPTGKIIIDSDGADSEEVLSVEGFHVNIRTWCDVLSEALVNTEAVVNPVTPAHVWA